MGKLVVMTMMVGLCWVGLEVYTEGPRNAFGGVFSFLSAGDDMPEKAVEYVSTPQRVGRKVDAAIQEGAARYEEAVGE